MVLEEFLAVQRKRLKPRTLLRYEDTIGLLKDHLNGYGHTSLSKAEAIFFDRCCNSEGSEQREFCQVFGPEKIIENMGDFLGYFMVRKVMAGADFKRSSGTVMKKLSKWLTEKGYISEESARDGVDEGSERATLGPVAVPESATFLLAKGWDISCALGKVNGKWRIIDMGNVYPL